MEICNGCSVEQNVVCQKDERPIVDAVKDSDGTELAWIFFV
jgi:hypothetical protein